MLCDYLQDVLPDNLTVFLCAGASGKVLPHYTVKPEPDDFPDAGSESSPDILIVC